MSFFTVALVLIGVSFMESHRIPELPKSLCDYTYVTAIDGWYKLHKTPATLFDAVTTCNKEGANLMLMETEDLIAFQKTVLKQFALESIHTGIKFPTCESQVQHQPFPSFHELAMLPDGTLNHVDGKEWHPFICYRNNPDTAPAHSRSVQVLSCDQGYNLDDRTNKCYKLYWIQKYWRDAKKSCEDEGANLAIINSVTEASVIIDLFAKYPVDSLTNIEWKRNAFVGVKSDDLGLTWNTIDGKTLQESGYSVFSPGEPNNARGDEYCVSVGRDGKLFDEPCTRDMPYICEKEARVMFESNLEIQDKVIGKKY